MLNNIGFTITPYSQYHNITKLVLAAGEEAAFQCQYCVTEDIFWIINGEVLNEQNLPEDIAIIRDYNVQPYCGALYMLRITNISNYNLSIIKCGPKEGSPNEASEPITLCVQGT